MTFIECCQKANVDGLQVIREISDSGNFECRNFTEPPPENQGWVYLDAWTASAVCVVYNALSDKNKAHLEKLSPMKAISVCWKLIK